MGLSRRERTVAIAHSGVESGTFVVDAGFRGPGTVIAAAGAMDTGANIDFDKYGEVRLQTAAGDTIEVTNYRGIDATATTLVDQSGIGEAVANHDLTFRQRGANDFGYILSAAGEVEQKFGTRVHAGAGRVEQDAADFATDGRATGFNGFHDVATSFPEPGGKGAELGSFAAAVSAFESDELAAMGHRKIRLSQVPPDLDYNHWEQPIRRSGRMKWFGLAVMCSLASGAGYAQQPASSVSFEFFRDKVQPIFLAKRPGHARCVECHDNTAPRLQEMSAGAATWNEEQSRKNFDAWKQLVAPGDPTASRMLMHPLAREAGGDPFHAGGKHFKTQNDPEWQVLAAWVRTGTAVSAAGASTLDFQYFRQNVEPIFLKDRDPAEGSGNPCASCHTRMASRLRLQPLKEGAKVWSEEQSRTNFETVSKLVIPGDPAISRLLLHPLATNAGGDPAHTGGKFWTSRDNPEWKTIAAWVQGGKIQ